MSMPPVDTDAPNFELNDQNGEMVRLRDLKGKWVVLYFYPKDDTSGCTKEACSFRDNYGAIAQRGAVILGVSADTEASHQKFARKNQLPFRLLVDSDHEVAKAYGAWGTKSMYGRTYEGIIRSTFVIGPDGRIAKTWPRVRPADHGQEVLTWLTQNAS